MNVAEVCNREVVVIGPDESVTQAARLLASEHVGCLVVVSGEPGARTPLGIVTDRDIAVRGVARELDLRTSRVRDVMSAELLTASESEDMYDVLKQMRYRGVRRVPVVDDRNCLQGIVAYDDVIEGVAEELSDLTRLLSRERQREASPRGEPSA